MSKPLRFGLDIDRASPAAGAGEVNYSSLDKATGRLRCVMDEARQ